MWDNDYKHPVVLAKELATMDLLSDGRLEIGLGAGWMITDYEQSGMPYDRPGVRIDRFVEGLAIIKGAMGAGAVLVHQGTHYTVTELRRLPKPVQAPCPPILIGGGGKRVLGIAAREADIVGINGTMHAGVDRPRRDRVDDRRGGRREGRHRARRGRRTAAGDRDERPRVHGQRHRRPRRQRSTFLAKAMSVEPTMVEQTPFALIGPPSKLVEDLLERRERWGFSYIIVGADDVESFAPVVAELAGR